MKVQRVSTPYDPEDPEGPTFSDWMEELDRLVLARSGLSVHDLPDVLYWDAWDAGESVENFFEAEIAGELESLGWDGE